MQKKKHKVTKQVYRIKKDGRLSKNSDLTQEIEKPTIEKISATPVNQIVPNGNLASSDIAQQVTRSAGGQDQTKSAGTAKTGLTGHEIGLTGPSKILGTAPKLRRGRNQALKSFYANIKR